jgi:hypothetical protein
MPKAENVGAINCRPPKDPVRRSQYLVCKDLATKEFKRNRSAKKGVVNFGELFLEMALVRYAAHFANEQRTAPQPTPQNPEKRSVSSRPSVFAGLGDS